MAAMELQSRVRKTVEKLSPENPFRDADVDDVPRPKLPTLNPRAPVGAQVAAVQRVIAHLQYNFLPTTFFALQKNRPLRNLLTTAQEILSEALPIRCLEATFLAVYLTQPVNALERFPLAFKSICNGKSYRHIVLVVHHPTSGYGALGLSRVGTLMDKPMVFPTLVELLDDYAAAYAAHGHELASIKLGLQFSHDSLSRQVPFWRFISTPVPRWSDMKSVEAEAQPPPQQQEEEAGNLQPTPPSSGAGGPRAPPHQAQTIQHGRRRGQESPAVTPPDHPIHAPTAAAATAAKEGNKPSAGSSERSYRSDPAFALLIDRFCEMLPELSAEYNDGMGEAIVTAQAAARRVGRTMERQARGSGAHSAVPVMQRPKAADVADDGAFRAQEVSEVAPSVDPHEERDDDSDSEDNAFRVSCVRQLQSPFARVAATNRRGASVQPGAGRAGVVGRLRGMAAGAQDAPLPRPPPAQQQPTALTPPEHNM